MVLSIFQSGIWKEINASPEKPSMPFSNLVPEEISMPAGALKPEESEPKAVQSISEEPMAQEKLPDTALNIPDIIISEQPKLVTGEQSSEQIKALSNNIGPDEVKEETYQGVNESPEEELFIVKDGVLKIYESPSDPEPTFTLHNHDCIIDSNPETKEITITYKPDTNKEENYCFMLPNEQLFDKWCQDLQENGFNKQVNISPNKMNQVGVVNNGILELYRFYGIPGAKPIMTLFSKTCKATTSEERREITIRDHKTNGKVEKITLDCSNKEEYERWMAALAFGGFIKDKDMKSNYGNLTKYVFPINLFDDKEKLSSVVVTENAISLYASPTSKAPLMVLDKDSCEIKAFIELRKIRIYKDRNLLSEERIDFIVHLAKEFDSIKSKLEKYQFKDSSEARRLSKNLKPFVLCRKGSIAIYKDKFQQAPDFTIEVKDYTAEINRKTYTITFTPNESASQSKKHFVRTLVCPDLKTFQRWDFTLRVSNFQQFSEEEPPKFFLPTINYGHICIEALDLNKPPKSRPWGKDFFRIPTVLKSIAVPMEDSKTAKSSDIWAHES